MKKDGKYALSAEGKVSVVGISGLSLSGPISISYNGFNQLLTGGCDRWNSEASGG